MAKTPYQIKEIADNISQVTSPIIDLSNLLQPGSTGFVTSIVNRAAIPDLSKDLSVNMGINRIMTQQIFQIQNEFGPNGEPVWGVLNDTLGQIRFVGNILAPGGTTYGIGISQSSPSTFDFVEITFYGTGLNVLCYVDSGNRGWNQTVDGVGPVSGSYPSSGSNIICAGRNTSGNTVVPVCSGLPLGIHTVKLNGLGSSNFVFFGFETLNESSSIKVNPGSYLFSGKRLQLSAQQAIAYNSSFESGTLGTRGGHALVYQKSDGSIAKAVTPTATSGSALGSSATINGSVLSGLQADHIRDNEELVKVYNWREFGASRSTNDDFNMPSPSNSNLAFTLDDGTTTLVASGATIYSNNSIYPNGANSFFTFTFVGTGVDIIGNLASAIDAHTIYIDGVSVGSLTANIVGTIKLASGLPYGTHTLKILRTVASTGGLVLSGLKVYGPKKPILPTGAVELADYYAMADYVANVGGAYGAVSTGVLGKVSSRELIYVGSGWSINTIDVSNRTCPTTQTSTNSDSVSYVFWGKGFDFRFPFVSDGATNILVQLQSLSTGGSLLNMTPANFSGLSAATYGVLSKYNTSTAVLDESNGTTVSDAGLNVSGLALGLYKVVFTKNSGGTNFRIYGIDIITPIHSPRSNLYADLQNTLPIGSQGIGDLRRLMTDVTKQKAWAQAIGVTSAPASSSVPFLPVPDMSLTIKTNGNPIEVQYGIGIYHSGGHTTNLRIYVDGVAVGSNKSLSYSTTIAFVCSDSAIVPVAAGVHKVDLYWGTDGATASSTDRILKAREL